MKMNKPMLTNPDVEYTNIKVNFDKKTKVTIAVCTVAICIVAVVLLGLLLFFVSANNLKTETNNLKVETKLPPPGADMMAKGMFRCLVYFSLNTFFSHPGNSSSNQCVVYCQGVCYGYCCEVFRPYCDMSCGFCCCHW